ncbi:MAG: Gfo/Idh/MocA family oxidoreductase [Caldilineaceae bacterium]
MHILDLTLWLMGNPQPVAVTGVADARLAHHPGQFGAWQDIDVPADFDVEDFAAALVRFDNGATLVLEVELVPAPQHPGRGHADVALRHRRRLSLAQGRVPAHQLRHAPVHQLRTAAHPGSHGPPTRWSAWNSPGAGRR